MKNVRVLLAVPFALSAALFAGSAEAGIGACGDIDVSADANCKVEVAGGCKAQCQPINFTAACYADCKGGCNLTIDSQCTTSCTGGCDAECTADPGNFSCEGSCKANCDADCSSRCTTANDSTQCTASCQAACTGDCRASCEGTPPSASCEAQCNACCTGECNVDANFDCQIDCQAGCTAELTGGCEVQCDAPEGALFCDGQFIDSGGNLQECISALNALLEVQVDVSATFDAECENGQCTAEGEVSVGCAMPGVPHPEDPVPWFAFGLAGVGLLGARRRRR